jgi:hypothetical protein
LLYLQFHGSGAYAAADRLPQKPLIPDLLEVYEEHTSRLYVTR